MESYVASQDLQKSDSKDHQTLESSQNLKITQTLKDRL